MIEIFQDEEFKALDDTKKKEIAINYFNSEVADEEFNGLPDEEKSKVYDNFFRSEVIGDTNDSGKIDFENTDIDTLKQEVSKEEFETRKSKVMEMPEGTDEERLRKKKAYITLNDSKENLSFFDRQYLGAKSALMGASSIPIGIAEISEDVANIFRDTKATSIEDFRKDWQSKIKEVNKKLGFEEDDILTPSLGGQIAGEIAGVGTVAKVAKTASVAATAATEGVMSFISELGTSGDYSNAVTSGALAGSLTGIVGRWVEGKPLSKEVKTALNEKGAEELTGIASMYEFARNADIKLVDALVSNNPDEIAKRLKEFSAPEAMVQYAETLRSDTGKKLLDAFNGALKDANPKDIEDISIKKIAGMIQGEASALKTEMNTLKNNAYTAMKESPLKDTQVNAKEVLDLGMNTFDTLRADSALVNAYKRNVLKNISTLDTDSSKVANRIRTVEDRVARNESRLAGFEVVGADTKALEESIIKDMAELDQLANDVDITKLSNVTLEDMVGIIQDMNELKYSGSSHVATKGAKEQKIFNDLNSALLSKIESTSPEFHGLAKDASEKARDIFSIFGKQGRGTREFPELEVIRTSNNPDDIAKKIFSSGATDSGFKIEETLRILGSRNPALQKAVVGRYIDDAMGGLTRHISGKDTIQRSVLDMKESTKAIDGLIGTPDARRLTENVLGKDKVEILDNINIFVKNHADNLDAMKTPKEKDASSILSKPVLKQLSQMYNYVTYKGKNIVGLSDEFHSQKYAKKINEYIKTKLDSTQGKDMTRADWNRLGFALSGSSIEKYLTNSATIDKNERTKEKLRKLEGK